MSASILCLDCGFVSTGAAIISGGKVKHCEVIGTKSSGKKQKIRRVDEDCERIVFLTRTILGLIRKHNILAVIVEFPHGGAKSSRAARTMGMATAMVATIAEVLELPLITLTPADVKKITGRTKKVSKEDVEEVVLKLHPEAKKLLPKTKAHREHCADAIGAWIAGRHDPAIRMLERIES